MPLKLPPLSLNMASIFFLASSCEFKPKNKSIPLRLKLNSWSSIKDTIGATIIEVLGSNKLLNW